MKNDDRNKGYALAGVIMFLLLVAIMLISVTRQVDTSLNIEEYFRDQELAYPYTGDVNMYRAISWALTLSETNIPNTGNVGSVQSYWVEVGDNAEKYVIEYERINPWREKIPAPDPPYWEWEYYYNYEITARPFVAGDDDAIDEAPQWL